MGQKSCTKLIIFKWTFFTTIGWLVGLTLALVVAHPLEEIKLPFAGMGVGIAAGIGLLQWVILRKHITNSSQWILFSVVGLGGTFLFLNILHEILGLFNIIFIGDGLSALIPIIIGSSLGGYLNGRLQEKYVLRKITNQSKKWAMTSLKAWFVASTFLGGFVLITTSIHLDKTIIGPFPSIIVFFSVGPIIGLFTAKEIVPVLR